MTALLDTIDHQPRSRAVRAKTADFSPKAEEKQKVAQISEFMRLFGILSDEWKDRMIAYIEWLSGDCDPATDPRSEWPEDMRLMSQARDRAV